MTCDDFQIAIERRLHGDLGDAGAAPLDRHLSSCQACRSYEAAARRTEVAMGARAEAVLREVDWGQVQEGLRRYRRRVLRSIGEIATFLALVTLASVVWPLRESGRAELALRNGLISAGVLGAYALGAALYGRSLSRLADPVEVLAVYRNRVRSEARWMKRAQWAYPLGLALVAAVNLLRPSPGRLLGSLALGALIAAAWAWDRLVRIPRVEREWADLEPRA
jgi:hypothetical protein